MTLQAHEGVRYATRGAATATLYVIQFAESYVQHTPSPTGTHARRAGRDPRAAARAAARLDRRGPARRRAGGRDGPPGHPGRRPRAAAPRGARQRAAAAGTRADR